MKFILLCENSSPGSNIIIKMDLKNNFTILLELFFELLIAYLCICPQNYDAFLFKADIYSSILSFSISSESNISR